MPISKEIVIAGSIVSGIIILLVPAIVQSYKTSEEYGYLQGQVLILEEKIATGPLSINSNLIELNDRIQILENQIHDAETRLSTIQNCFFAKR